MGFPLVPRVLLMCKYTRCGKFWWFRETTMYIRKFFFFFFALLGWCAGSIRFLRVLHALDADNEISRVNVSEFI